MLPAIAALTTLACAAFFSVLLCRRQNSAAMSDDGYCSSAEEGDTVFRYDVLSAAVIQQQRQKAVVLQTHVPEILLYEKVNWEMLQFFVGNPEIVDSVDKSDTVSLYSKILAYAQRLREDDTVEVSYEQVSYRAGRYYAQGVSLQNFPSAIRDALTYDILHDCDVANWNPTLLMQLAQRHNIPCKMLERYVHQRDAYLAE
jgi:hypothetical protein